MGRPLFYLSSAFCSVVIASVSCFFTWHMLSDCAKRSGTCEGLAEDEQLLSLLVGLVQQHRDLLFRPCSDAVGLSSTRASMVWRPLLELKESLSVMFFYSFYCPYYCWLLLARSLHLLSHLLFDSWHAERWLAVPLSPKIRKHPSVFILFCTIYLPLLCLFFPSIPGYSRWTWWRLC